MSSSAALSKILERPDVWRGDALASAPLPGVPSGFAELDAELPSGGWPRGGLIELLPARCGVGELGLLLPALARISGDELAWLVCVAPPYLLYAPALEQGGIALARLLVASAPGRDAPWACERALASDGVGAVVAWLPEAGMTALRRLQLAAEASRTLFFAFRPASCAGQSSPAPLRLALESRGERLLVRLLKRRGGARPAPLSIAIDRPSASLRLPHALACTASAAPSARSLSQPATA
ncbi:MAG: translesion DNA synthesis-associated protein ImuA [Rhodocyclaceae bacterium]